MSAIAAKKTLLGALARRIHEISIRPSDFLF